MKTFAISAFLATTMAFETLVQPYWTTKDDSDNAKRYWDGNFEAYRAEVDDADSNNCQIYESHNFYGAQQCKFSWECRGARVCERGGWCDGYDGCDGTIFPYQAPGLLPDC